MPASVSTSPSPVPHRCAVSRAENCLSDRSTPLCTVTIDIDEKTLRDVDPNLSDIATIRRWVQELVDLRIQQMEFEDTETMSIEEAREMTIAAVREEYARP